MRAGSSLRVSAVTSMRDAAHCHSLRTAVEEERMMDGRNGRGTLEVEAVLKDSTFNASACDHPSLGAAVRRAKPLEQFLEFRRTDHPGRTALATGRCCFLSLWGHELHPVSVHRQRAEEKNQKFTSEKGSLPSQRSQPSSFLPLLACAIPLGTSRPSRARLTESALQNLARFPRSPLRRPAMNPKLSVLVPFFLPAAIAAWCVANPFPVHATALFESRIS
jgi:hypothetical protein